MFYYLYEWDRDRSRVFFFILQQKKNDTFSEYITVGEEIFIFHLAILLLS